MSDLIDKCIDHIVNERFDDAKVMIRRYPVLLAMTDARGIFPLHYALAHHAPLRLISIMVREWPAMMNNTSPIRKLDPLHWTCRFNMPPEVLQFMLQEFPDERIKWDRHNETPLMCYLKSGDRDPEVIKSLLPWNTQSANIGDVRSGSDALDVCRLDYKDPTLTKIVLSDTFENARGCDFFDVMDAIYCNPYVNHLEFLVYATPTTSFMWREGGMGRNAVMFLLRDKKSVKNITIRADVSDITVFADVLQECIHMEHLEVSFDRVVWSNTIEPIIQSIRHLPRLRRVTFVRASVNREAAIELRDSLIAKRSMVSLRMIQCTVFPEASTVILEALRSDTDCTLRDVSLFDGHRPLRSHEATALRHDREIHLAVDYNLRVKSIKEFVTHVTCRDINGGTENTEFKDIQAAIRKDEADFEWRDRPDHLYSLFQVKPEYIQIFVEHKTADSIPSKRMRLN